MTTRTTRRGRTPRQPAFSDIVIDDEELECELRIILENQPTLDDLNRGKARRAATKKAKDILLNRHRDECFTAKAEAEWIRVGDAALISPVLIHHNEEEKTITAYEGGKDDVSFEIQHASWQLQFGDVVPEPDVEMVTMQVNGSEAPVRRRRREAAPSVEDVAFGPGRVDPDADAALSPEARKLLETLPEDARTPAVNAEEAREQAEAEERLRNAARP